jgi:hypothetical protein
MFSSQGLAPLDSASAPGLGSLLGVPGLLGTFILPVPVLVTAGTLISP